MDVVACLRTFSCSTDFIFQINEIHEGRVNDFTRIHVPGVYSRWSEKLPHNSVRGHD